MGEVVQLAPTVASPRYGWGKLSGLGLPRGASGGAASDTKRALSTTGTVVAVLPTGELSCMYRYILRESCSQFDSLPLTYLLQVWRSSSLRSTAAGSGTSRRSFAASRFSTSRR